MELDGVLCGNSLLKEFFNEFLRLAVFPIPLSYNDSNGMITETNGGVFPCQHEPGVRIKLLDWAENYRWPFFLKSRLYHEYCLCVLLFPQTNSTGWIQSSIRPGTASNGLIVRHRSSHLELVGVASETRGVASGRVSVMSLGLPDEIWEEEPVAMVTENSHANESYLEFQKFKSALRGTTGETLMEVWLRIVEWKSSGCHDNWLILKDLRRKMNCVHLSDHIGNELKRMECALSECLERLKTYWLFRYSQCLNSDSLLQSSNKSCTNEKWVELESCDTQLPFIEGLRCNNCAGNPFQIYLERSCPRENVQQLKLWECCDLLLTQQIYCKEKEFVRECWRIWSTFLDDGSHHCVGQIGTSKEDLFSALKDDNGTAVREKLHQLQLEVLSLLKRLWTRYLHDDHQYYQQCIGTKRNPSYHDNKDESIRVSSKSRQNKKRRKKRKREMSIDLTSGPLELLGDMETLLNFEHYLFTECGPLSVENICYQLWKNILKYCKISERKKQDALAVQIHRTFVYHHSNRCITLPDTLKEQVDPQQEFQRPATPTLLVLQDLAAEVIEMAVKRFLYDEEDGLGSLPRIMKQPVYKTSRSLSRGSKISRSSTVVLQEESLHLTHTLLNCEGKTPHKLQAFASYLEDHAPSSVKGVLVNNVQFWLEVKKFKAMYDNETNLKILFHKGEAIVDRYLDTTSPPWVKVSVNSEVAMHIVAAVSDLSKVKVRSHIDKLCDLLLKAQELTFTDMLPHWGVFCKQYKSPDGSVVSLPPVTSCMASSGSQHSPPTVRLPPVSKIRDRTPLLSYSQYKGLQWKSSLQHSS